MENRDSQSHLQKAGKKSRRTPSISLKHFPLRKDLEKDTGKSNKAKLPEIDMALGSGRAGPVNQRNVSAKTGVPPNRSWTMPNNFHVPRKPKVTNRSPEVKVSRVITRHSVGPRVVSLDRKRLEAKLPQGTLDFTKTKDAVPRRILPRITSNQRFGSSMLMENTHPTSLPTSAGVRDTDHTRNALYRGNLPSIQTGHIAGSCTFSSGQNESRHYLSPSHTELNPKDTAVDDKRTTLSDAPGDQTDGELFTPTCPKQNSCKDAVGLVTPTCPKQSSCKDAVGLVKPTGPKQNSCEDAVGLVTPTGPKQSICKVAVGLVTPTGPKQNSYECDAQFNIAVETPKVHRPIRKDEELAASPPAKETGTEGPRSTLDKNVDSCLNLFKLSLECFADCQIPPEMVGTQDLNDLRRQTEKKTEEINNYYVEKEALEREMDKVIEELEMEHDRMMELNALSRKVKAEKERLEREMYETRIDAKNYEISFSMERTEYDELKKTFTEMETKIEASKEIQPRLYSCLLEVRTHLQADLTSGLNENDFSNNSDTTNRQGHNEEVIDLSGDWMTQRESLSINIGEEQLSPIPEALEAYITSVPGSSTLLPSNALLGETNSKNDAKMEVSKEESYSREGRYFLCHFLGK